MVPSPLIEQLAAPGIAGKRGQLARNHLLERGGEPPRPFPVSLHSSGGLAKDIHGAPDGEPLARDNEPFIERTDACGSPRRGGPGKILLHSLQPFDHLLRLPFLAELQRAIEVLLRTVRGAGRGRERRQEKEGEEEASSTPGFSSVHEDHCEEK